MVVVHTVIHTVSFVELGKSAYTLVISLLLMSRRINTNAIKRRSASWRALLNLPTLTILFARITIRRLTFDLSII